MRGRLGLRAGERVQVKSKEEILATLDSSGALDHLPFMPEMLAFCGKEFVVGKRADKSCDTVTQGTRTLRRMFDTVHLEGTRCSGAAHDGCEARCTIFWKEAWLRRVPATPNSVTTPTAEGCTEAELQAAVYRDTSGPEPIYRCQATDHLEASIPMSWWNLSQHVRDIRGGNVRFGQALKGIAWWAFRYGREHFRGYRFQIRLFNAIQRIRGGRPYEPLAGDRVKTPKETLDLQPGELVQIKSVDEIRATLDQAQRNRGLYFDHEMTPFCDGTYRVLARVSQIIDEPTGTMRKLPGDCLLLDGVVCSGRYHLCCPRAIPSYWREIWLRRVNVSAEPPALHEARSPR